MSACAETQSDEYTTSRVTSCIWYAVRVHKNCEWIVGESLHAKGYEEFVPSYRARRRWSGRTNVVEFPLFPGYVFCRLAPEQRPCLLEAPELLGAVGENNRFVPLEETEIEAVRAVLRCGCELRPWPYLRVGRRVRIRGGALDGMKGLLLDLKDSARFVISLNALQRSLAATLDSRCAGEIL